MAARFDIQAFSMNATALARLVPAGELFSLLERQVQVPAGCAALAWGETSQPFVVPAGHFLEGGSVERALIVRTSPFHLEYRFAGLASKDDFEFAATVRFAVCAVADKTELMALHRAVVGADVEAGVERLRTFCEDVVRSAVAAFARARAAEQLAAASGSEELGAAVAEAFRKLGFESGLALDGDVRGSFESPTFRQVQQARRGVDLRRQRLETEQELRQLGHAARARHLAEVSATLEQLRAASAEARAGLPELIRRLAPQQRGEFYHALAALHEPLRPTRDILIVAGDELLWVNPAEPARLRRRVRLESAAGPLRSIRVGYDPERTTLLVGARRGVHVLDGEGALIQTYLARTAAEPRGGFNAAVTTGGRLYATHSELGLVRWPIGAPTAPERCIEHHLAGSRSVRDVQADGAGRVWFSIDNRVACWSPDSHGQVAIVPAPAVVASLLVVPPFVYAGLDNGGIVRWPTELPGDMEVVRVVGGGSVDSLGWLESGGIARLLVVDRRPLIELRVIDDAFTSEYRCDQSIRWGLVAEDWVVGVADRRDQVVLWRIDTPHEPAAVVSIGRLCGHAVQDAALLAEHRVQLDLPVHA